jgi:hypothetical protein
MHHDKESPIWNLIGKIVKVIDSRNSGRNLARNNLVTIENIKS